MYACAYSGNIQGAGHYSVGGFLRQGGVTEVLRAEGPARPPDPVAPGPRLGHTQLHTEVAGAQQQELAQVDEVLVKFYQVLIFTCLFYQCRN